MPSGTQLASPSELGVRLSPESHRANGLHLHHLQLMLAPNQHHLVQHLIPALAQAQLGLQLGRAPSCQHHELYCCVRRLDLLVIG